MVDDNITTVNGSSDTLKILCIGDPHFKRDNIPEMDMMTAAILNVITPDLDLVVVMGDTLDRFGDIRTVPLTRAVEFLNDLRSRVRTVLIIGNHDLPHKDCDPKGMHPFTAFHGADNITVIDEPQILNVKGHSLTFTPYYEPGQLIPILDEKIPNWKTTTAVFGHQELRGCPLGAKVSADGDVWKVEYPLAIMGHIHDYVRLSGHQSDPADNGDNRDNRENIIYVGTPMQHSYADSPDKTISLYTWSDKSTWTEDRIDLNLPRHIVVRITTYEIDTYQPPTNSRVKMVITGSSSDNKLARKSPKVAAWRKMGIKVDFNDIGTDVIPNMSAARVHRTFGSLLYETVKSDPDLANIYNSLWPGNGIMAQ